MWNISHRKCDNWDPTLSYKPFDHTWEPYPPGSPWRFQQTFHWLTALSALKRFILDKFSNKHNPRNTDFWSILWSIETKYKKAKARTGGVEGVATWQGNDFLWRSASGKHLQTNCALAFRSVFEGTYQAGHDLDRRWHQVLFSVFKDVTSELMDSPHHLLQLWNPFTKFNAAFKYSNSWAFWGLGAPIAPSHKPVWSQSG